MECPKCGYAIGPFEVECDISAGNARPPCDDNRLLPVILGLWAEGRTPEGLAQRATIHRV